VYTEAIGLGLVISLIFFEGVGLAAGGMVVPGYIALNLTNPWEIAGTMLVAFATFGLVKLVSRFTFLYGRRRLVLTILLAFVLGTLYRNAGIHQIAGVPVELQLVGFIIPGLMANTMEQQGVWETMSALLIVAVMVRMALILINGGEVAA
jgi:poly-gamma-glutamate biosynthesis protein PgsC/CapC